MNTFEQVEGNKVPDMNTITTCTNWHVTSRGQVTFTGILPAIQIVSNADGYRDIVEPQNNNHLKTSAGFTGHIFISTRTFPAGIGSGAVTLTTVIGLGFAFDLNADRCTALPVLAILTAD